MVERFARHQVGGVVTAYDLKRVQDNIERVLNVFSQRRGWLAGKLIEDVALTAGVENLVEHGLGATVQGWWIVDKDANANIWRVSGTTSDGTKYLALATSTAVNVELIVW